MSADVRTWAGEAALQQALLDAAKADAAVRALLGDPARIFDGETDGAAFPYAVLERHEVAERSSAGVPGQSHTVSFGVRSRYGGRRAAMEVVGALRASLETAVITLPQQRIVLLQTVYADVMRTPDLTAFRGVLRVRVITEETA